MLCCVGVLVYTVSCSAIVYFFDLKYRGAIQCPSIRHMNMFVLKQESVGEQWASEVQRSRVHHNSGIVVTAIYRVALKSKPRPNYRRSCIKSD